MSLLNDVDELLDKMDALKKRIANEETWHEFAEPKASLQLAYRLMEEIQREIDEIEYEKKGGMV